MYYKNVSSSVKTFHGVTFEPGQTKQVSRYINNKYMILTNDKPIETQKKQQKPSSEKLKDDAQKKDSQKSDTDKKDDQKQDNDKKSPDGKQS